TEFFPGRVTLSLKADEFFIFESCNGAQEVEDRPGDIQQWDGLRLRFDSERIPGSDPSLFQYPKAIKSLKGETHESSIDDRYPLRVRVPGHGIEQHRAFLRSASLFSGARSSKESGGRRGCFSPFL